MPRRIVSPANPTARPIVEPIVQPLYDRTQLATTVASENRLFAIPRGQSSKTTRDTNLDLAGALSNPKIFVVLAQSLTFSENVAESAIFVDLKVLGYNGYYELFIGNKNYLQIPVFGLPSNYGIQLSGSTSTGSFIAAHFGGPIFKNGDKPITIPPQQNFNATLFYPVASTINVARDVWAFLHGFYGREVQ